MKLDGKVLRRLERSSSIAHRRWRVDEVEDAPASDSRSFELLKSRRQRLHCLEARDSRQDQQGEIHAVELCLGHKRNRQE